MPNEKMDKAIKDCKAYRKYLKEKGIPDHLATKGFLITRDMIDRLFAQSNEIAGIRIYVGLDESTAQKAIKPYAVGCVKVGTNQYNDWNVPKGGQSGTDASTSATSTTMGDATNTTLTALSTTTDPVVEEPRPCPAECGDTNDLNSGS